MNKEDYVSLEVAKLLKEKGYPQEYNVGVLCRLQNKANPYYENIRTITQADLENTWCIFNEVYPTLYEAQKWLREQNNIYITVFPHCFHKYGIVEYEYRISTYFDLLDKQGKCRKSELYYLKYEQCLDDAILDSLKNQEIFKNSKSE